MIEVRLCTRRKGKTYLVKLFVNTSNSNFDKSTPKLKTGYLRPFEFKKSIKNYSTLLISLYHD